MTHSGHIQRKSRPWVAMVAAYAIALQMLLSAAVASQMAAASPAGAFPICYGVSIDGADKGDLVPVHQASCVLCTVGFSAPVDLVAPVLEPAAAWTDIVRPRMAGEAVLAQAPPGPRLSQGPPHTV